MNRKSWKGLYSLPAQNRDLAPAPGCGVLLFAPVIDIRPGKTPHAPTLKAGIFFSATSR